MLSSASKGAHQPRRPYRRARRFALRSAAYSLVAATVNLGLYAIGKGAGAALRVDPGVGAPNHLIIPGDVVWKTLLPIVLGACLLAFTAHRSPRWTATVMVAGAAVAAISVQFVLVGAHDLLTGVLLACMHTAAGLAFVLLALRVRPDLGGDGRRRTGAGNPAPAITGEC
ncbi:DUF6069 family protein [Arthrobacter sp. 260]|uniref:DUF6069 family protein n=1 Tax=Arthrobacter sp. 260 TaxID=2735314 RepID=UPI001492B4B7|nr:DUF6069 family protein [Arthrobacter sp. 260]NOJ61427.1 hypothetical protein [Arthrobacter sp. 260]